MPTSERGKRWLQYALLAAADLVLLGMFAEVDIVFWTVFGHGFGIRPRYLTVSFAAIGGYKPPAAHRNV